MSSRSPVSSTLGEAGARVELAEGGRRLQAGGGSLTARRGRPGGRGVRRLERPSSWERRRSSRRASRSADAADSSVDPGADCPPVPDSPPTTIIVPAGRSVSPSTVTEPATGLLAETRRSGWVLWLMTCISTGALPPARYTAAVSAPAGASGKAICASRIAMPFTVTVAPVALLAW